MRQTESLPFIGIAGKLMRMNVPVHRPVPWRGSQVLTNGYQIDTNGAEIGQGGQDLFLGLSHANDQTRLDRTRRIDPLRSGQQRQRTPVVGGRPHRRSTVSVL